MKVQIRALYCCVNEGETSWETHIVEGRLGDALSAELERPQPDENVLGLLEQLGELQVFLRAKQYDRAEALAERLRADLEPVLPNFQTQISLLAESGAKLERGEAEEVLALLGGVTTALLRAEADTQCGTAQVYLGDAAAEQTFRAATEHDPKHYRALTNLGNVLLEAQELGTPVAVVAGDADPGTADEVPRITLVELAGSVELALRDAAHLASTAAQTLATDPRLPAKDAG